MKVDTMTKTIDSSSTVSLLKDRSPDITQAVSKMLSAGYSLKIESVGERLNIEFHRSGDFSHNNRVSVSRLDIGIVQSALLALMHESLDDE